MAYQVPYSQIIAESKASYNQKYVRDGNTSGTANKYQCWYLDQTGFPRFTDNLLLKHHSISNCGIIFGQSSVYVLKSVNNGKAVFQAYPSASLNQTCGVGDMGNFSWSEEPDIPATQKHLSQSYIRNGSGIQQAMKVTALPTTTSTTTMYVVVPTETND